MERLESNQNMTPSEVLMALSVSDYQEQICAAFSAALSAEETTPPISLFSFELGDNLTLRSFIITKTNERLLEVYIVNTEGGKIGELIFSLPKEKEENSIKLLHRLMSPDYKIPGITGTLLYLKSEEILNVIRSNFSPFYDSIYFATSQIDVLNWGLKIGFEAQEQTIPDTLLGWINEPKEALPNGWTTISVEATGDGRILHNVIVQESVKDLGEIRKDGDKEIYLFSEEVLKTCFEQKTILRLLFEKKLS